jgi:two-component system sensor histidine kinase/response regulator
VRETVARQIAEQRAAELELIFEGSLASESELMVPLGAYEVWFSVTLSPVHDVEGEVMAVVAFASDVTARRQAARALSDQAERLRAHNRVFVDLMSQRATLFSNPAAAFRRITEAAAKTLDVARASIWFYDESKSGITCVDLFEKETDKHSAGVVLAAKDFPAYFRGLLEERTIAAEDAHTHPMTREFSETYLKPLGIGAMLDVPIWVEGDMVGVVCHEHVGPEREWSPDEENFAYLMGSVASLVRSEQQA